MYVKALILPLNFVNNGYPSLVQMKTPSYASMQYARPRPCYAPSTIARMHQNASFSFLISMQCSTFDKRNTTNLTVSITRTYMQRSKLEETRGKKSNMRMQSLLCWRLPCGEWSLRQLLVFPLGSFCRCDSGIKTAIFIARGNGKAGPASRR